MHGAAVQDYLKVICKFSLAGERCTPSVVAERMAVSPAAVTKMLRRLTELRLVEYARGGEITLTPAGEKVALEMIRHHRLLELYLMEALGYTWDKVDSEAERLEHVISEEFEARIDELLGFPTHDPHGDPIPTKDGFLARDQFGTLAELQPGTEAVVRRVRDGDPALLRYLGDLGLYPSVTVRMERVEPYGGPLRVTVNGTERAVGRELASSVFVEPAGTGA